MQIRTEARTELNFCVEWDPCPWTLYVKNKGEPSAGFWRMKAWQEVIARTAAVAMKGKKPFTGPIHLKVAFYLAVPPRAPKGAAARARWIYKQQCKKPDTTNLLKGFEDALKGCVWEDDSQVIHTEASKEFGERAYTLVTVKAPHPPDAMVGQTHTARLSGG